MPQLAGRNTLVPAEQGLDVLRSVIIGDAMDDNLTVLFQLPHVFTDVIHAVAKVDRATVYVLTHPVGGTNRIFAGKVGFLEEGTVTGNTLTFIIRSLICGLHIESPLNSFSVAVL